MVGITQSMGPWWVCAVLSVLGACCQCQGQRQNLRLVVDARLESVPVSHFWRSTGFCPPSPHQKAADFDLSPDMVQNSAYIGAVPHRGIRQVRIHWLLDLVTVERLTSGWPVYNFTNLDWTMDLLHRNALRPGFELMGNPSAIFMDLENKTQLYWWRDLVRQTALRYIDRYGLDWVKQWNFETWNEPDCHDFDQLKMTMQGFLNYYDACSEGLREASPLLLFGGPADGCDYIPKTGSALSRSDQFREALFQHVVNGTNYFTGEKGVRLDFISLHRKGNGKAVNIMEEELKSMAEIGQRYPPLAAKPFYNDEADPLVGWSKDESWRATADYAALVVKVICQHQNVLLRSGGQRPINYTLLSNDNAFLSYHPHQFTQRTLLARFQINSTEGRVKYVAFVRKPVYAAMVLLSKLGHRQVFSQLLDKESSHPLPNTSCAGCLATEHRPLSPDDASSDGFQWSVVVYSSSDTSPTNRSGALDVDWTIPVANATDLRLAVYLVDNKWTNPYRLWREVLHQPDFPSPRQFEMIRQQEGPYRYALRPAWSGSTGAVKNLPGLCVEEPSALLLHLCQQPPTPPEQVAALRLINITSGQVLVVWSDENIHTKCIKTYEVEQQQNAGGQFVRINSEDTIVNLFVHTTDKASKVWGRYRVRAVDYWERPGPYSLIIIYPRQRPI